MSHGHFIRAVKEWGVVGTFKKLYKMRTLKFGSLVGVDHLGNEYYENVIDYPHGACARVWLRGWVVTLPLHTHPTPPHPTPPCRPAPVGGVRRQQELL